QLAEQRGGPVQSEQSGTAAGEHGQRLRAVALLHAQQLLGDAVERLVPGHALELALPAPAGPALRVEQPMLAVVHLHQELALRAEVATGDRIVGVAGDAHDLIAAPVGAQGAAVEADVAAGADHLGAEHALPRRRVRERFDGAPTGSAGHAPPGRSEEILSAPAPGARHALHQRDRKSTRLNSSHRTISYAVFCLKKKT